MPTTAVAPIAAANDARRTTAPPWFAFTGSADPRFRPGVAEGHGHRGHLSGTKGRVAGLPNELAMEAEIAGEHEDDRVVLQPGDPIDDGAHRDPIDPGCGRCADRERESPDHSRKNKVLGGRGETVRPDPGDRHAIVGKFR